MTHATRIGRFVGLAVGLGIGAALAAMAGIAWADDFQISIDGMDLFPTEDNTAAAFSGTDDIAIAIGAGSTACAGSTAVACGDTPGYFDSAFANGTGSTADTGEGYLDSASATGDGTAAGAGYGNFDTAVAIDTGPDAGALAGGGSLLSSSDDSAFAWGPQSVAGAGDSFGNYPNGNDIAAVFDPLGTEGSSAYATGGYYDLAAAFGDDLHAITGIGNFMVDILPSL